MSDPCSSLEEQFASFAGSDERERPFLDRYVFQGVGRVNVPFDAPAIVHFKPMDFLRVLERCVRFGVSVFGVEVFTPSAEMVHVQTAETDSPAEFMPLISRLLGHRDLTVAASYRVPARLLTTPAVSEEMMSHYRECTYALDLNGSEEKLVVGTYSEAAKKILRDARYSCAYVLFAGNPFSLLRQEGKYLEEKLLRLQLEELGVQLYTVVASAGSEWEEHGFLVVGLSFEDAEQFGVEFGQNAVLKVDTRGLVQVVTLR